MPRRRATTSSCGRSRTRSPASIALATLGRRGMPASGPKKIAAVIVPCERTPSVRPSRRARDGAVRGTTTTGPLTPRCALMDVRLDDVLDVRRDQLVRRARMPSLDSMEDRLRLGDRVSRVARYLLVARPRGRAPVAVRARDGHPHGDEPEHEDESDHACTHLSPSLIVSTRRKLRGPAASRIAIRAITARPNAAARAPSTTRWSKVIASAPVRRTTISPSRTTARGATRPMLRIATSGWLTIGVWKSPASLPALDTVNVEPRRSSAPSDPVRARSASAAISASELVDRLLVRPRGRPARRDRRRSARRPRCRSDRGRGSRRRRSARSAPGTRRARRRTPSRPSGGGARAERPRSRTPPPRSRVAPRDALGPCARRSRGGRLAGARVGLRCSRPRRRSHVVLRDAAARPGARNLGEVDTELLRDPTNDGSRLHAPRIRDWSSRGLRGNGCGRRSDGGHRLARLADHDELRADGRDRRPPPRGSSAPCRRTATGSRPSPCRSGSRRAGRPRRSPAPR